MKKAKYTLLYKASKDGDSSIDFHNKCKMKNSTVVLIDTYDGWRFGGYTESIWDFNERGYTMDGYKSAYDTFIFSLNLKKKYKGIKSYVKIYVGRDKGPSFGEGDIVIENECLHRISKCRSPETFGNLKRINEFNGGKEEFIAKEVEVFQVEFGE